MRLSKHFTLREMTRSQTAERHGISNQPSEAHIKALTLVCMNVLEPVRERFGVPFTPSSGYRTKELCKLIGSSAKSQHAKGQAVDFEVPSIDNLEVVKWIYNNIDYDQLILECYKGGNTGWIHCSHKLKDNRNEVYTYNPDEGYVAFTPVFA